MDLKNWILIALAVIPLVFVITILILNKFYKGTRREIVVVKKRTVNHTTMSQVTYAAGVTPHRTGDCTYKGSKRLHTLGCEDYVFSKLREGKSYTVTVKFMYIEKIIPKSTDRRRK